MWALAARSLLACSQLAGRLKWWHSSQSADLHQTSHRRPLQQCLLGSTVVLLYRCKTRGSQSELRETTGLSQAQETRLQKKRALMPLSGPGRGKHCCMHVAKFGTATGTIALLRHRSQGPPSAHWPGRYPLHSCSSASFACLFRCLPKDNIKVTVLSRLHPAHSHTAESRCQLFLQYKQRTSYYSANVTAHNEEIRMHL